MGLGVGKRTTLPTVPMILAASMGPMPKISVRVVPEASTSASMRSFRSTIFRSSVRTSRSTSEASCRRGRRAAALSGRMPRRMRAARWAESVPATPPGTRSRRSPCRRLSALVRSATRSSRLSESSVAPQMRPRDRPPPAARCARLPRRWPGHRAPRSCGHCRSRAPAPGPKAWAGRPPHTRRAPPTSSPGAGRDHWRSPPLRATLAKPFRLERSRALKPARFCGKLARSMSSPTCSSTAARATDALWGSTPIKTFMSAGTSVFGRILATSSRAWRPPSPAGRRLWSVSDASPPMPATSCARRSPL